jgi:hypothetical protein
MYVPLRIRFATSRDKTGMCALLWFHEHLWCSEICDFCRYVRGVYNRRYIAKVSDAPNRAPLNLEYFKNSKRSRGTLFIRRRYCNNRKYLSNQIFWWQNSDNGSKTRDNCDLVRLAIRRQGRRWTGLKTMIQLTPSLRIIPRLPCCRYDDAHSTILKDSHFLPLPSLDDPPPGVFPFGCSETTGFVSAIAISEQRKKKAHAKEHIRLGNCKPFSP